MKKNKMDMIVLRIMRSVCMFLLLLIGLTVGNLMSVQAKTITIETDEFVCEVWDWGKGRYGSLEIVTYKGKGGDLVIPEEIEGHPVKSLAWDMFVFRDGGKNPDTGRNVRSISLPASLMAVGSYEDEPSDYFAGMPKLESIYVHPDNKYFTAQDGVLFNKNKTQLLTYPMRKKGTAYKIPKGVKVIGAYAFSGARLKKIEVPNSVVRIWIGAFQNNDFKTISLTNVRKIDAHAFENCRYLKNITLSKKLTYIGVGAFRDCRSLTKIELPKSLKKIKGSAFENCIKLKSISIPKGVTEICPKTFYKCKALKNVELPNGLVRIGGSAFRGCDNLTKIVIPRSATRISKTAFFKRCKITRK